MRGTSVLLVVAALLSLVLADPCTIDDYIGQYTECRVDDTRDYVYYLKAGVTCDPVTGIPPPNTYGLQCNLACGAGQYLPPGATACQSCPPGSYSRSGTVDNDEWNAFPAELGAWQTFCIQYSTQKTPAPAGSTCSQWALSGTYVGTGLISGDVASVLQLTTTLLVDGNITFTVYVDGAYWLGLYLKIDSANPQYVSIENSEYNTFTYQLSSGVHVIQWQFAVVYPGSGTPSPAYMARISDIEIFGIEYATQECTPCPPGTFAGVGGSSSCTICPTNTISTDFNTSTCTPCAANQYAYPGDNLCVTRQPCTASDTVTLLGTCSGGRTTATQTFLDPVICDTTSFALTNNPNAACAPCNPGYDRVGDNCVSCPSGQYSPGGDVTSCQNCAAGSVPATQLDLKVWHTWSSSMSTNCSGDCGSTGWRLQGSYIDSGVGHGDTVSSNFYLTFNTPTAGVLTFNRSLNCPLNCVLYVYYGSGLSQWESYPSNTYFTGYTTESIATLPGQNVFKFSFTQEIDPINANPTTKPQERVAVAAISEISITNAVGGTATGCVQCQPGQIVQNGVNGPTCIYCNPGSQPGADLASCTVCSGNMYSKGNGDTCHACGSGTTATTDHSDCTWTCTATVGGRDYDLNMIQTQMQYQPNSPYSYVDFSTWPFTEVYLSPCSRAGMAGADGGSCPNSYTCISGSDGGYVGEFQAISSDPYAGVKVHYFNGAVSSSCPNGNEVYASFTCYPNSFYTFNYTGIPGNPTPCSQHVELQSAYGCPICSIVDTGFFYSDCINGSRTKTYYWLQPGRCNNQGSSGILFPLPPPETIDCSLSTVVCAPGQYLASDNTCANCPAGSISDGGELMVTDWSTFPSGFFTICSSVPCSVWSTPSSDKSVLRSGSGTSSLLADISLKKTGGGNVNFDFKMYTINGAQFVFYVDEVAVLNYTKSALDWVSFSHPMQTSGSHNFRWTFTGGVLESPSALAFEAVYLTNVVFTGYDYHSDTCTPCPAGYYSNASSSACSPCPENTFNDYTGAGFCSACDNNTYTIPGQVTDCTLRYPCQPSDYDTVYGPCQTTGSVSSRSATLVPKKPSICLDTTPHDLGNVACAPCPPSTTRSGANCVGCDVGQYFSNGVCTANPIGNTVQRSIAYFTDNSISTWPAEFTTGCSGNCKTDGWHIGNGFVDSGDQSYHTVDSWLTLSTTLVSDGSIEFNYNVSGTYQDTNGFFLLVDGAVTPVPTYQTPGSADIYVKVPLSAGVHTVTWDWHQDDAQDILLVHDIIVTGASNSIITGASVPCPAGQFSNVSSNVVCSVCPAGTFSQGPSATGCTACPANQYAVFPGSSTCSACDSGSSTTTTGNTACTPQCTFSFGSDSYSLETTSFNTTITTKAGTEQYYINVCGFTDQCSSSHICLASGADLIPFGASFRVASANNASNNAFSVFFEHGDSPSCPQTASTQIDFFCEPSTTDSTPSLISNDGCLAHFSWQSASACRICQDSDYVEVVGVCSGGHRTIVKNRNTNCNGPASITEPPKSCSSHEFPTGAVVAVVVVFVVVVAAGVGIFIRHRIVAKRYQSLLDETKSGKEIHDGHL